MSTSPSQPAAGAPVEGSKQVELLISLAREQAIESTKDADAIEGKARSVAQMATVFFAASQATVGLLLATRPANAPQVSSTVAWAAVVLGALALLSVLFMAWRVLRLHRLVTQDALEPEVLEQLLPFAEDANLRVPTYLLDRLVEVARSRRTAATDKADALRFLYAAGYVSLAASGSQILLGIIVAFATR